MNRLDEGQLGEACQAVVDAARALAAGTVPFVEGVRQLAALRSDVSRLDHDPDFMLFVGVASEADHLPSKDLRSQCSPAWLEQCDREAQELEAFYRDNIRAACVRLVGRFSS